MQGKHAHHPGDASTLESIPKGEEMRFDVWSLPIPDTPLVEDVCPSVSARDGVGEPMRA